MGNLEVVIERPSILRTVNITSSFFRASKIQRWLAKQIASLTWQGGSQIDTFDQIEVLESSAGADIWCRGHRIVVLLAGRGSTTVPRCSTAFTGSAC